MKLNVICSSLVNVDTSEISIHTIKDYDLSVEEHRQRLHRQLDCFISMLLLDNSRDSHDTYSMEFRSYRRHEELELPF